jgi:hypothetical protein
MPKSRVRTIPSKENVDKARNRLSTVTIKSQKISDKRASTQTIASLFVPSRQQSVKSVKKAPKKERKPSKMKNIIPKVPRLPRTMRGSMSEKFSFSLRTKSANQTSQTPSGPGRQSVDVIMKTPASEAPSSDVQTEQPPKNISPTLDARHSPQISISHVPDTEPPHTHSRRPSELSTNSSKLELTIQPAPDSIISHKTNPSQSSTSDSLARLSQVSFVSSRPTSPTSQSSTGHRRMESPSVHQQAINIASPRERPKMVDVVLRQKPQRSDSPATGSDTTTPILPQTRFDGSSSASTSRAASPAVVNERRIEIKRVVPQPAVTDEVESPVVGKETRIEINQVEPISGIGTPPPINVSKAVEESPTLGVDPADTASVCSASSSGSVSPDLKQQAAVEEFPGKKPSMSTDSPPAKTESLKESIPEPPAEKIEVAELEETPESKEQSEEKMAEQKEEKDAGVLQDANLSPHHKESDTAPRLDDIKIESSGLGLNIPTEPPSPKISAKEDSPTTKPEPAELQDKEPHIVLSATQPWVDSPSLLYVDSVSMHVEPIPATITTPSVRVDSPSLKNDSPSSQVESPSFRVDSPRPVIKRKPVPKPGSQSTIATIASIEKQQPARDTLSPTPEIHESPKKSPINKSQLRRINSDLSVPDSTKSEPLRQLSPLTGSTEKKATSPFPPDSAYATNFSASMTDLHRYSASHHPRPSTAKSMKPIGFRSQTKLALFPTPTPSLLSLQTAQSEVNLPLKEESGLRNVDTSGIGEEADSALPIPAPKSYSNNNRFAAGPKMAALKKRLMGFGRRRTADM